MNRTIKDATLKVFRYPDIESLKAHVLVFVKTYNFAKHLKALRWKTPFEAIAQAWTNDPSNFKINRATSFRDQTPRGRRLRGLVNSRGVPLGTWSTRGCSRPNPLTKRCNHHRP